MILSPRFDWRSSRHLAVIAATAAALYLVVLSGAAAVDYDIVYVRAPRFGDTVQSHWPEIMNIAALDAGADLMLLHPNGAEEVLVSGGVGSVTDPFISFDAQWCYYAYFPNLQTDRRNEQRNHLPRDGSDIYRINLKTRIIQRLTHQDFTPNTGAAKWDVAHFSSSSSSGDTLGYGILNLGPVPLAGGKVAFVSNRNGFLPTKGYTPVDLQLFVMDEDGENVTPIAPMTLGSALHPTPLVDGRVMFSTYETQGLRDVRLWGIWAIQPDGSHWEPLVSAFNRGGESFHFMTQLGNGDLVVENYYNGNNNGFGAFYRFPVNPPGGGPQFGGAFAKDNPPLALNVGGQPGSFWLAFSPRGMFAITPFTHGSDDAAPIGADGRRVGKFTHPSSAPHNDLLCVWTPGPANNLERPVSKPYVDGGLYLIRNGGPARSPADLVVIKNDPRYNEMWPRAVVPYSQIYGVDEPRALPWLPNDGQLRAELPAGTPYGIVGTSSFYKRESFPGFTTQPTYDGLDVFNSPENDQSSNWFWQGADAGKYTNADIYAVRILELEPTSHTSYGPNEGRHFFNHANERMRILGEIPLRKFDPAGKPVLDPEGNPDTSFLAKIAADTPFTFQMLDRNGMVLTMAQTWHQVRPGEVRADCGGCHAHSQTPLAIERTAAGRPDYKAVDLTHQVPLLEPVPSHDPSITIVPGGTVTVEFYRNVRPILQRSCVPCHSQAKNPAPGNLVLDDYALYKNLAGAGAYESFPGDYARLALDRDARWGFPPVAKSWRQTNASRYIRMFQSRRSLLVWKLFGKRLDGWTNGDHPTEAVPGDASTLPKGSDPRDADLDYTGTIMPPPGSGAPPLTDEERLTIVRWIDLGCPIDLAHDDGHSGHGWFLDEVRPTVAISLPRPNANTSPLTAIRVGFSDADSGIDLKTVSVTADVTLSGYRAGSELSKGLSMKDGMLTIPLVPPVASLAKGHLTVRVRDLQGNETKQTVRFSVGGGRSESTSR